jgi:transcriptional regulator with XRE-family HTH domain
MLGEKLRELREAKGLVQRQIAAKLEVDTAFISKIENGEKHLSKTHLTKIAKILNTSETELKKLWLSDKIFALVKDEPTAIDSLKIVLQITTK